MSSTARARTKAETHAHTEDLKSKNMYMNGIKHTLGGHPVLWKPHVQSRPDTGQRGHRTYSVKETGKTQKPDST